MNEKNLNAIKLLKEGKIGIFPTDTAFGIGCRMDKPTSIKKIYEIRKRPHEKALLALVSTVEMAEKYVYINADVKEKLIKKYWPGGLTLILKCKKENVPEIVRAGKDTLAVRLPDNKKIVEIIEKVGVPIVAPSANFSGYKTPLKLSQVDKNLLPKVDFVLAGVCTMEGVSTIVDCTKDKWEIVRKGVIRISNSELRI
jgi:L-threonylcarbamoyladenylate synthase